MFGNEISDVHRTAVYSAALRAAHYLSGSEPKIFEDRFALRLSGLDQEEAITFGNRVPPESASTCILRGRFAEDRLVTARGRLDQYVILGAGLDSYALRMGDEGLGSLTVFEVEDPPFQEWKRQRLESLGVAIPQQLRFVPCDFERMSLQSALAANDFDEAAPCFISWLGVTQYLTRGAIQDTLRWAARRPAGSELVLTFVDKDGGEEGRPTGAGSVDYTSYFTVAEMDDLLREAGFARIEHLTLSEATTYFKERADGLVPPRFQRLAAAIT